VFPGNLFRDHFDLRYRQLFLSINFLHRAGGGDFFRFLAQVFVEVFAGVVVGQVIGHFLAIFGGLNGILAFVAFFEDALGAFAFASNGDFLAFFVSKGRCCQREQQSREARNNSNISFHGCAFPVFGLVWIRG
jgi:hypothetical protein